MTLLQEEEYQVEDNQTKTTVIVKFQISLEGGCNWKDTTPFHRRFFLPTVKNQWSEN